MMVVGAIMGLFVVPVPSRELGIALSVVVWAGCIACRLEAPVGALPRSMSRCSRYVTVRARQGPTTAADPVSYSEVCSGHGLLHRCGISALVSSRTCPMVWWHRRSMGAVTQRGAWGPISSD